MDDEFNKTKDTVKRELANFLGLDPEDIEDDSSLTEDLHMKASDVADFMEILTRMGMDLTSIKLAETETFLDLIEAITENG